MNRKLKLSAGILLGATLLTSGLGETKPAFAASGVAVPNYEVKWYMDPAVVLDSNHKLKSAVLSDFDMPTTVEKMNVEYLDSDDLELNDEGWNVRIRKKEEFADDEFEVTYKKRYSIVNGNIQAALEEAADDGFDSGEEDYEAQVEWGYSSQTLSFSNDKDANENGYDGMELPDAGDSRDMAVDKLPGKLDDWKSGNWASDILEDAHIYGPVEAKRSIGEWDGQELYIEVWKILNAAGTDYDYLVEASMKIDDYATASSKRDSLKNELIAKGWFLPTDGLKTSLILDRY